MFLDDGHENNGLGADIYTCIHRKRLSKPTHLVIEIIIPLKIHI